MKMGISHKKTSKNYGLPFVDGNGDRPAPGLLGAGYPYLVVVCQAWHWDFETLTGMENGKRCPLEGALYG